MPEMFDSIVTLLFKLPFRRRSLPPDLPRNVSLYPVASSTAAKSGLRLVCAQSCPANLSYFCVQSISRSLEAGKQMRARLPPGLNKVVENNLWSVKMPPTSSRTHSTMQSNKWIRSKLEFLIQSLYISFG